MANYVETIGLISCLLLCLIKWEWLDYYAVVKKPWMPEAGCYLCLGFWMAIAYHLSCTVVIDLLGGGFSIWQYVVIPFHSLVCAPFINIIVMYARGEARR